MASEERDFLGLVAQAAEAATIRTREPVCRPVPDIHQLQLRAARRRVERHFLKSSCPEKRRLFNRVNAVCRRHANRRTRQSWQGICHSLNEAKGGSRAWRLLRCLILGPAVQQPVLAVAIYLGISEEALAERLADRFATIPVTPPDALLDELELHRKRFVNGDDEVDVATVILQPEWRHRRSRTNAETAAAPRTASRGSACGHTRGIEDSCSLLERSFANLVAPTLGHGHR
ncbi:hypothetical protein MTO96_010130 [Rhipicephalus appendiculatus]